MQSLTSNQHYGAINRRFDRRAARLKSLGFRYERIEQFGIAVFIRGTREIDVKKTTIPASTVAHADNRSFIDILSATCRRSRG